MKNLLLFSIFLLTTANIFAQLRVRKNSGNDTYIYVDNTVLFVEQEISLGRNTPGGNTEASIYLRNNGQLIQGSSNSNNSGRGQISVQQNTPVTNAYAYYYWCSPVGDSGYLTTGQGGGNKNFGVGLLYEPQPGTSETAAQQVATTSGLNGLTTSPITVSTRWLYTFESPGTEREGNYTAMGGGLNAPPGFGFTMKGVGPITDPQLDQTYEFRGRPNNGTFTIPVAAPGGTEGMMTLTGNPYPSALDLNKLYYDPENTALGTFWYYDEDRTVASHYYATKPFGYGVYTIGPEDTDGDPYNGDNLGTYAAAPFSYYTSGGGTTGSGGTSSNSDDNKRFAPIAQGIMFVGDADGTVQIKNAHRVFYKEGEPGSVFQRPDGSNTEVENDSANGEREYATISDHANLSNRTPMMRLWAIFDKNVTRDMVIAFYDNATDGYDRGLDGLSAQDLHTDAYFPIGPDNARLPYVINGTNYVPEKYIPIAFKIRNTSLIELRLVEEINQPYERAYLYDSQENTYKQLNGATLARVTLTLPPGTYDNRFFIFFRGTNRPGGKTETELDIKSSIAENVSFFQNNKSRQLEVRNPEGYVIKSASVFDMSGKLIINEKNLGSKSQYSFYTGNLSSGVYLVKLVTDGDVAIDYKAVVHND
ncbi:T9SS type A sorting domain-containing protein [Aequorivita flava]|uniref:T9SS type A sorting domain-containing protein n=1 Tax=Aequorivita flava TaxID=3114371 RepID=A0AB35YPT6_9FLAO